MSSKKIYQEMLSYLLQNNFVKNFHFTIRNLIFPEICSFCGSIVINKKPYPNSIGNTTLLEGVCKRCMAQIPFRGFSGVRIKCLEKRNENEKIYDNIFNIDVIVACYYDNMMRRAILSLKFYEAAYMKHALGSIISYIIKNTNEKFDLIIPVPLHEKRKKERGYNQAELIASKVSNITGIPIANDCLIRNKNTKRQSEMAFYTQRLANLQNAFICYHPEKLTNKKILLFDDILTSGETLNSAANAIKDSVEYYNSKNLHLNTNFEIIGIALASSRK